MFDILYVLQEVSTAEPANEPVTLAEVQNFCKVANDVIDSTLDNALLNQMIKSVRQFVEHCTDRQLITKQWQMIIDCKDINPYPIIPDEIQIPKGYIQSIDEVLIVLEDDTTSDQATKYHERLGEYAKITLKLSSTWTTTTRTADQMKIKFTAGYGDDASDVPEIYKDAMLEMIYYLYENREAFIDNPKIFELQEIKSIAARLLDAKRVYSL